jgi:hypothetical protein
MLLILNGALAHMDVQARTNGVSAEFVGLVEVFYTMMVVLVVPDKDLHLIIMLAGVMRLQQVRLALLSVHLTGVALLLAGTILQVAQCAGTFTVGRDVEEVRQGHGIRVGGHTPSVTTGSGDMELVVQLLRGRCRDSASANTKQRRIVLGLKTY